MLHHDFFNIQKLAYNILLEGKPYNLHWHFLCANPVFANDLYNTYIYIIGQPSTSHPPHVSVRYCFLEYCV